jgi:hypothetical protein
MKIELENGTIISTQIPVKSIDGIMLVDFEPEKPKRWKAEYGKDAWIWNIDYALNIKGSSKESFDFHNSRGEIFETPELAKKDHDKKVLLAKIWDKAKDFDLADKEYQGILYYWGYDTRNKEWKKYAIWGILQFLLFPNFKNKEDRDTVFQEFKDRLDIFLD